MPIERTVCGACQSCTTPDSFQQKRSICFLLLQCSDTPLVTLPGHVLVGSILVLLAGHPVVLCTDDQGVFQTSLSKEYAIAAQAFQLTEDDLWTLVLRSVEYTFLSNAAKAELTDLMQRRQDALSVAKQS